MDFLSIFGRCHSRSNVCLPIRGTGPERTVAPQSFAGFTQSRRNHCSPARTGRLLIFLAGDALMKRINKVAVLGAGTMGARIAAHFANAGVPALLLDIVPPDADGPARNKIAAAGLDGARKSKPAAFFEPSLSHLVTVGNFDDDLKRLADVDWIIEAIVENLEIKRSLLKKVEAIRKPGTIITTNTSGLPVAKIADGFSADFRRSWFGTHFFNPPRYMRLLELIPTPEADPALLDAVTHFCDQQLGKGVVLAKDTPNFIANRIGKI